MSKFGYASILSANGSLAVISAAVAPTGNFGALYVYALDKSLGAWNLKNMISNSLQCQDQQFNSLFWAIRIAKR